MMKMKNPRSENGAARRIGSAEGLSAKRKKQS
jgi:hypothetical protein